MYISISNKLAGSSKGLQSFQQHIELRDTNNLEITEKLKKKVHKVKKNKRVKNWPKMKHLGRLKLETIKTYYERAWKIIRQAFSRFLD